MIYGDKKEFWEELLMRGLPPKGTPGRDKFLCRNQIKIHQAGFREAALVATIFGYSVRLVSGLCDNEILFGGRREGRNISYKEALEWGKAWVDQSPDFRVLNYGDIPEKEFGPYCEVRP